MRYVLILLVVCCGVGAQEPIQDRTMWKKMLAAGEKERKALIAALPEPGAPKGNGEAAKDRAQRAATAFQTEKARLDALEGKYLPTIELCANGVGVLRRQKLELFAEFTDASLYRRGAEWFWIEPAGDLEGPFYCTCVTKAEIDGAERTVYVLVPLKKP